MVFVFLRRDFQARRLEYFTKLRRDPGEKNMSEWCQNGGCPKKPVFVLLVLWLVCKRDNFMPVSIEYVLLATSKVRMNLARKQCVLRYVGISRVFIHGEHK